MGFIGEAIGSLGHMLGIGGGKIHEPAPPSQKKAILAATKELRELKRKQGYGSTLFAGGYKPPKELQTLFAQDMNKKTLLGA